MIGMSVRLQIHSLKIVSPFFEEVDAGRKRFELRKHDRDFQVGDLLELCQWDPERHRYTGHRLLKRIDYILTRAEFPTGVVPGFVVLSIGDPTVAELRWYANWKQIGDLCGQAEERVSADAADKATEDPQGGATPPDAEEAPCRHRWAPDEANDRPRMECCELCGLKQQREPTQTRRWVMAVHGAGGRAGPWRPYAEATEWAILVDGGFAVRAWGLGTTDAEAVRIASARVNRAVALLLTQQEAPQQEG